VPLHFHTGHPTPWTEGLVIRFWNEDGTDWVGNFQNRWGWSHKVLSWPEAEALAVLVRYDFYLIDFNDPSSFVTLPSSVVSGAMLDDEHKLLFVTDSSSVHAFGRDRQLLWKTDALGGYFPRLMNCVDGVLSIEVEEEMDEPPLKVRLSEMDGSIL